MERRFRIFQNPEGKIELETVQKEVFETPQDTFDHIQASLDAATLRMGLDYFLSGIAGVLSFVAVLEANKDQDASRIAVGVASALICERMASLGKESFEKRKEYKKLLGIVESSNYPEF